MNQTVLLAIKRRLSASYWADVLEQAGYTALIYTSAEMDWSPFVRATTPHILFLEAAFADDQGFEMARFARLTHPALRCVVCMPPTSAYLVQALQTDISGYLPEDIDNIDEVLFCLERISQGYRYISPVFRRISGSPTNGQQQLITTLSHRRKQILRFLAKGYTARQIALELRIAEATVRHHKEQIAELVGLEGVYQLKVFVGSIAHLLE